MCMGELHYPDKLLRERAPWVLWDIDWGDDPVSLHAFELAVHVSGWKRYLLQILGQDGRDSSFLDLWKGNDLAHELSRDHISAVKNIFVQSCVRMVDPEKSCHIDCHFILCRHPDICGSRYKCQKPFANSSSRSSSFTSEDEMRMFWRWLSSIQIYKSGHIKSISFCSKLLLCCSKFNLLHISTCCQLTGWQNLQNNISPNTFPLAAHAIPPPRLPPSYSY